ncbi:MAG: hypothetical protein AAF242_18765 [Bacteroidota bacterium]
MFIPPQSIQQQLRESKASVNPVRLQSSHLVLNQQIANEAFGEEKNVYVVYYPDRRSLMLAPITDELFKNLHKASQQLLKDRSLKGDKSLSLHEYLIDNQLDDQDRPLDYEWQPAVGILKIEL